MNTTFNLIGIDVPSEKAFNVLAAQADDHGEPTRLARDGAILHGRCWKLGEGLEVWTVLYERGGGEVFYADCRPGFRARSTQTVSPWALTEYTEEGEAIVHGYLEDGQTEVLFQLQNLTEVGATCFHSFALHVSLCGLAYQAQLCPATDASGWRPLEEKSFVTVNTKHRAARRNDKKSDDDASHIVHENDWSLRGRVLECKQLSNPLSGSELVWARVDTGFLKLEILINPRSLVTERGAPYKQPLTPGAVIAADVWLQGHVINAPTLRARYEGVDRSVRHGSMWRGLRRHN